MSSRIDLDRYGKLSTPPTFFLYSPIFCILSGAYFFCLDCPILYLLSFTCNTHNTNIHAPGGIRIHNPSKRSAVDPRFKSLGHWDQQRMRSQDPLSRSVSVYRLSYPGPRLPFKVPQGTFHFSFSYECSLSYNLYYFKHKNSHDTPVFRLPFLTMTYIS